MECRRGRRGLIIVDSSAIIAILFGEPSAPALLRKLADDPERLISVASYVEAGTVIAGRLKPNPMQALQRLDLFLAELGITLSPIDENQARVALRARIQYGRGMGHGGQLNFGDAFSYALAKTANAPLLYIGDDFTVTDIADAP